MAQSRMRRQAIDLDLSSALLLDPHSGHLLLSDLDSGDIVNCSATNGVCVTLVNTSNLQPQDTCGGTGMMCVYSFIVVICDYLYRLTCNFNCSE